MPNKCSSYYALVYNYIKRNLVIQIIIGMVLGILLAFISPTLALNASILGSLFIGALKAIAPILVFILVLSAITNQKKNQPSHIRSVIILYVLGTFSAALISIATNMLFPVKIILTTQDNYLSIPQGIKEILEALLFKLIDNPISALAESNYIGILAWAAVIGITLTKASDSTKIVINDFSNSIALIVDLIIKFAPLGIFGLVSKTFAENGISTFVNYAHLLKILILNIVLVSMVINPLIVYYKTRRNPFALVFQCLKESGITAFFTRSSTANIPINLALCKKLQLDKATYAVSIPLGAIMNMGGAAVTITTLTLAAVHTLAIEVDLLTALLFSIVTTISAFGASGVTGGSLLLIPLTASLFGINDEIAIQIVAIGFIISVIQDSLETAINSSTDVLFTAACCYGEKKYQQ